jgi:hypothetical protein
MNTPETQPSGSLEPVCSAMCDVPQTNWKTGQMTWAKEPCDGQAIPGSKYCPWHQDREPKMLETKDIKGWPNAAGEPQPRKPRT